MYRKQLFNPFSRKSESLNEIVPEIMITAGAEELRGKWLQSPVTLLPIATVSQFY